MYTALLEKIINKTLRLKVLLEASEALEALEPKHTTFFRRHKDNILLKIQD